MSWIYLMAGIVLEVAGTVCLKMLHNPSKIGLGTLIVLFYGGSVVALAITLKHMPASLAYAVWSAVGTALVAAVGMLWFKEPATAGKVISIGMIIVGVVWLNLLG